MSAGAHDFKVQRGESWSALIASSDSTGAHINHTGYTVSMDVRADYESTTELFTLTSGNSRVSIDGSGNIQLSITKADTAAIAFDRGVYDLLVTSPGGTANFYLRGNFIVQKTVTR